MLKKGRSILPNMLVYAVIIDSNSSYRSTTSSSLFAGLLSGSLSQASPTSLSSLVLREEMPTKPVKCYVVDAFAESAFKGNPAAVCLLEEERAEEWLQSVAAEFNLSETCYLTRIVDSDSDASLCGSSPPKFRLRWFTPVAEVELCGHATMAASHVLFANGLVNSTAIEFQTLSGILTVKKVPEASKPEFSNTQNTDEKKSFLIEMDFPYVSLAEINSNEISSFSKVLTGASAIDIMRTSIDDICVLLPSHKDVIEFQPNLEEISKIPGRGLIITGVAPPESGFDFYSRFFCPKYGINEDPVCGSAHCALGGYWSKKLGKSQLVAYAASPRSGILHLQVDEQRQRVLLRGKAVTVMEGSVLP